MQTWVKCMASSKTLDRGMVWKQTPSEIPNVECGESLHNCSCWAHIVCTLHVYAVKNWDPRVYLHSKPQQGSRDMIKMCQCEMLADDKLFLGKNFKGYKMKCCKSSQELALPDLQCQLNQK